MIYCCCTVYVIVRVTVAFHDNMAVFLNALTVSVCMLCSETSAYDHLAI